MSRFNREDLDGMEHDALAVIATSMLDEGRDLIANADLARFILRERLEVDGATKLDTEHFTGTLKPGSWRHEIEDWEAMVEEMREKGCDVAGLVIEPPRPQPRVDQRVLNEKLKLGGDIAAIIERHRKSTRGESSLELKVKVLI